MFRRGALKMIVGLKLKSQSLLVIDAKIEILMHA